MGQKEIEKLLKESLNHAFEDLHSNISQSIFSIEDQRIKVFLLLLLDSYHMQSKSAKTLSSHSTSDLDEILHMQKEILKHLE